MSYIDSTCNRDGEMKTLGRRSGRSYGPQVLVPDKSVRSVLTQSKLVAPMRVEKVT